VRCRTRSLAYHHRRLHIKLLVVPLPKLLAPLACKQALLFPAMAQGPSSSGTLLATSSRASPTAPPISSILPLLSSTFFTGFSAISYISGLLHTVSHLLLAPFLAIISIAFYLLSPIIITSQILFDTFVGVPYRAAAYVLQALYPIYAFIGVACLSGIVIGLGARQVVNFVGWGLLAGEVPSTRRSVSPSRTRPQRKSSTSRGKRKVTLKTED